MGTRGDKLLLGFLVFSIPFYLLVTRYVERQSHNAGVAATAVSDAAPAALPGPDAKPPAPGSWSLGSYSLAAEAATRWKLPKRLREVSGLAWVGDGRLLAHDDEKGIVYEISCEDGSIVKAFGLADLGEVIAADFEGIAAAEGRIYLVTSAGRLYEFPEGADGQTVLYNVYTTGVGRDYEIEGLAYEPGQRSLLLISKNPRNPAREGRLAIYRWSIDTKQLVADARTDIPVVDFSRHIKGGSFQPSGVERHPVSGNYFVVAAHQGAIAEITPGGQVLAVTEFPAQWHSQAEGITFGADHSLIIADEGKGKRARLTLYPVRDRRL